MTKDGPGCFNFAANMLVGTPSHFQSRSQHPMAWVYGHKHVTSMLASVDVVVSLMQLLCNRDDLCHWMVVASASTVVMWAMQH
jgi:hypothetical protein